jgi:alkylated DNA nucleotide flippase Atl1
MLRDGLCMGGAPWHRVLNASGKISLPADAGGDRQRELLVSEGVKFVRDAVATGTFWTREAPFFAA